MISIIISVTGITCFLCGTKAILEPALGAPAASVLAVVLLVLGASVLNNVLSEEP